MTKVTKLYDFTQCELPDSLFNIKIHQKDIDKEVITAAEHFLTLEEQDGEIIAGDIVAVSVKSADELMNSDCDRFVIGKGFYSDEVENALLGKKKGDTVSVKYNDADADITVLSVVRRIVPELTDEMAAKLQIEDEEISTRDEYIDYVKSQLESEDKEKKQNAIWTLVSRKLLSESEFEIDTAEIDKKYETDFNYLKEQLEDDIEEFMQAKYHCKTMEENLKKFKDDIKRSYLIFAIAEPQAKEEGIEWSEDDYNATIEAMVNDDYTVEELKASMSYEDFTKQQAEDYLKEKVLDYFDDRFTVTLVD